MKIFAVMSQNPNPRLAAAVRREFPQHHLALSLNSWLVGSDASAQEVSDLLGILDGSNGAGLVLGVASYYGRAPKSIRNWITARWDGEGSSAPDAQPVDTLSAAEP